MTSEEMSQTKAVRNAINARFQLRVEYFGKG